MIRIAFLAAAALLLATPATAQSISQGDLQNRYDRALAAGYKALFLCSAIANAERNGVIRTPESVMEWELTGIQSPLNEIVAELPFHLNRQPVLDSGSHLTLSVSVEWAEGIAPRTAMHNNERGCFLTAMGGPDIPFVSVQEPSLEVDPYEQIPQQVGTFHQLQDRVSDALSSSNPYGVDARTTAVFVLRNGLLTVDDYAEGFGPSVPQRTWSVAKSIAATLVGAAVERGEIDVSASAGLGYGQLGEPRHDITVDHALRMATGRYSDTPGNRTDALYFGGATVDEVAISWPLVNEPGTVYRYANNDTLAAVQAIEHTFDEHPPSAFFESVGMRHTVAETDWQGNYILSSQVWSTAPDLARLGQLYLNDGVLPDGTRILPEGWVEYVSTPSGPQPDGARGWGYGAGWWLLNNSEGIPPDTFMAAGNRGQYIVVIPSRDIVIVRRGEDPAGGSGFDIEAFTRDVLAALED